MSSENKEIENSNSSSTSISEETRVKMRKPKTGKNIRGSGNWRCRSVKVKLPDDTVVKVTGIYPWCRASEELFRPFDTRPEAKQLLSFRVASALSQKGFWKEFKVVS